MGLKYCSKCEEDKDEDGFNVNRQSPDGHFAWCRECSKAHYRAHYQDNIDNERQRGTRRQRAKYQVIQAAKEVPCTDCGIRYPPYVMDFDHVRGTKRYQIGRMGRGLSPGNLQAEIDKCDVVCSNCHRERTFRRTSS